MWNIEQYADGEDDFGRPVHTHTTRPPPGEGRTPGYNLALLKEQLSI
jgi:hypothetical protein